MGTVVAQPTGRHATDGHRPDQIVLIYIAYIYLAVNSTKMHVIAKSQIIRAIAEPLHLATRPGDSSRRRSRANIVTLDRRIFLNHCRRYKYKSLELLPHACPLVHEPKRI